jgi:hypothetical protein
MAYAQRKTAGISPAQLRLLKTAVRQLGIDDDTYRAMLMNVAGVQSGKDLTDTAFSAVMRHLAGCGFDHAPGGYGAARKKFAALGSRPGMATAAQLARIETDWAAMRDYWEPKGFPTARAALQAFLRRVVRVEDLRFVTCDQAVQVITTLGKIKKTM